MRRALITALCAGLFAPLALAAPDGKKAFEENGCAACHEFGKDKKSPDLKGITTRKPKEWIVDFVMNPDKHYGEPDIKALIEKYKMKMPNQGLEQADAEAIYEYLKAQAG